tara:strand:- start:42 stop:224 length:183 start_codon:yes stop_codon:yes gene_type:complete
MSKKIKITQIKSSIGYRFKTKRTLEALGLNKMNKSVEKEPSKAILGMISKVNHLVKVEEV